MFPTIEELVRDPHYPKYHISTDGGWLNDPHPLYFKGAWHMFYQHSLIEKEPYGGPHGWGHIMSTDLVHWKHMPDAITPRDHGIAPDHHIWSGTLVDNNGVGTAIYTIENIDVWIATSTDPDLRTFTKYPGNPVVQGPPPSPDYRREMRDPFVWREEDGWYMTVGSGQPDQKGAILPLYRSNDLIHWEFVSTLWKGSKDTDHNFCECPAFFPVGNGKHALFMSHGQQYLVGTYKDHQFTEETRGRSDHGFTYVPQIARDDNGRVIMWHWAVEARDNWLAVNAGWASMMTIPRVVTLGGDNMLRFDPAPELEILRQEPHDYNLALHPEGILLQNFESGQFELEATFRSAGAKSVGISVFNRNATVDIWYDYTLQTLNTKGVVLWRSAPLPLKKDEPLTLRVFFDGSIIEVYANSRICMTDRTYAPFPNNTMVKVDARGGAATANVRGWKLKSIWT